LLLAPPSKRKTFDSSPTKIPRKDNTPKKQFQSSPNPAADSMIQTQLVPNTNNPLVRQSSNPNQPNPVVQINSSTPLMNPVKPSCWKRMQHPTDPESKMVIFRIYGQCPEFPEVIDLHN